MPNKWTDSEWWRWLPKKARVPRRMTFAFYVAVTGTILLGFAAIGPPPQGPYTPNVAVTAITGAAVIWYTFFTYRAANARNETKLFLTEGEFSRNTQFVTVEIENPTSRTVETKLFIEIWLDGEKQESLEYYRGEDPLVIHPKETKSFSRPTNVESKRDEYNDVVFESEKLLVRVYICWRDDLGEIGKAGPWHFRQQFGETSFNRISSRKIIQASFPDKLPTCK